MTQPRRRRHGRFDGAFDRLGAIVGVSAIMLIAGVTMMFRIRGVGDGAPRTAAEQQAMLASGDCAVAPNHVLVGKLVTSLAASRSRPQGGYQLEAVDRGRVFQVDAGDVTLVPCSTLQR